MKHFVRLPHNFQRSMPGQDSPLTSWLGLYKPGTIEQGVMSQKEMTGQEMPAQCYGATTELTVGLPVYNMASYVEAAVVSLLNQTASDFRLVISDNASDDGTTEILRQFAEKDSRVTLIEQTQNIGLQANFRAVFDACETPYFMWAAADDLWPETWIERLLPIAKSKNAIAFGGIQDVDENLIKVKHPANGRNLSFAGSRLIRRMKFYLDPGLLGRANPIYGIFRKDLLSDAAWSQFASGDHGSDVLTLYVMLEGAEIVCDSNCVLSKRRHKKSAAVSGPSSSSKPRFRRTQLPQFWKLSSANERVMLLLLYPLAAIKVYLAKIAYLKGRVSTKLQR